MIHNNIIQPFNNSNINNSFQKKIVIYSSITGDPFLFPENSTIQEIKLSISNLIRKKESDIVLVYGPPFRVVSSSAGSQTFQNLFALNSTPSTPTAASSSSSSSSTYIVTSPTNSSSSSPYIITPTNSLPSNYEIYFYDTSLTCNLPPTIEIEKIFTDLELFFQPNANTNYVLDHLFKNLIDFQYMFKRFLIIALSSNALKEYCLSLFLPRLSTFRTNYSQFKEQYDNFNNNFNNFDEIFNNFGKIEVHKALYDLVKNVQTYYYGTSSVTSSPRAITNPSTEKDIEKKYYLKDLLLNKEDTRKDLLNGIEKLTSFIKETDDTYEEIINEEKELKSITNLDENLVNLINFFENLKELLYIQNYFFNNHNEINKLFFYDYNNLYNQYNVNYFINFNTNSNKINFYNSIPSFQLGKNNDETVILDGIKRIDEISLALSNFFSKILKTNSNLQYNYNLIKKLNLNYFDLLKTKILTIYENILTIKDEFLINFNKLYSNYVSKIQEIIEKNRKIQFLFRLKFNLLLNNIKKLNNINNYNIFYEKLNFFKSFLSFYHSFLHEINRRSIFNKIIKKIILKFNKKFNKLKEYEINLRKKFLLNYNYFVLVNSIQDSSSSSSSGSNKISSINQLDNLTIGDNKAGTGETHPGKSSIIVLKKIEEMYSSITKEPFSITLTPPIEDNFPEIDRESLIELEKTLRENNFEFNVINNYEEELYQIYTESDFGDEDFEFKILKTISSSPSTAISQQLVDDNNKLKNEINKLKEEINHLNSISVVNNEEKMSIEEERKKLEGEKNKLLAENEEKMKNFEQEKIQFEEVRNKFDVERIEFEEERKKYEEERKKYEEEKKKYEEEKKKFEEEKKKFEYEMKTFEDEKVQLIAEKNKLDEDIKKLEEKEEEIKKISEIHIENLEEEKKKLLESLEMKKMEIHSEVEKKKLEEKEEENKKIKEKEDEIMKLEDEKKNLLEKNKLLEENNELKKENNIKLLNNILNFFIEPYINDGIFYHLIKSNNERLEKYSNFSFKNEDCNLIFQILLFYNDNIIKNNNEKNDKFYNNLYNNLINNYKHNKNFNKILLNLKNSFNFNNNTNIQELFNNYFNLLFNDNNSIESDSPNSNSLLASASTSDSVSLNSPISASASSSSTLSLIDSQVDTSISATFDSPSASSLFNSLSSPSITDDSLYSFLKSTLNNEDTSSVSFYRTIFLLFQQVYLAQSLSARHMRVPKISFVSFEVGSVALFMSSKLSFSTSSSENNKEVWVAFHSRAPYYVLDNEFFSNYKGEKPRLVIIGKIVAIRKELASEDYQAYYGNFSPDFYVNVCTIKTIGISSKSSQKLSSKKSFFV